MLARHRGRNDQSSLRQQAQNPVQFMFIDCDSNNGGINAKPDKLVRSFVMKSARNKKPWSTRPKSPKTDRSRVTKPERRSSFQRPNSFEVDQDINSLSRLACDVSLPSPGSPPVLSEGNSPVSSIFSGHSDYWSCESPATIFESPLIEHSSIEDVYSSPLVEQHKLPLHVHVGTRSLGSFDCLPIRLDASTESLLHRFARAAAPRLIPIDPHKLSETAAQEWIGSCIQSPNGASFIYAAIATSLRAAQLDSETYKWRAMNEVNNLLSKSRTSTDDVTIASVLMLLAIEEAALSDARQRPDEQQHRVSVNDAHQNGLRTMIQQRGGLDALKGNRCLQVFLLMHSTAQAVTTFKSPYAALVDADGGIEDYASCSIQALDLFPAALGDFERLIVDRDLLKITSTVAIFTADLEIWYEMGVFRVDSLELQKHASLLLYRLFDWQQNHEVDASDRGTCTHPIDQSICFALLIFMVNATEPKAGTFGGRLLKAASKLRHSIQKVPMIQWGNSPGLFFWILTMGALGARPSSRARRSTSCGGDLLFFRDYIRLAFPTETCPRTINADQLLGKMKACLWLPSIFDERAKTMWMTLGLCKPSISDMEEDSESDGDGQRDLAIENEYVLGHSTAKRFFDPESHLAKQPSMLRWP